MWVLKHLTSFKKKIICDVDCIPFKHGRTDILECRVCLYKDMSMSKMVHPPPRQWVPKLLPEGGCPVRTPMPTHPDMLGAGRKWADRSHWMENNGVVLLLGQNICEECVFARASVPFWKLVGRQGGERSSGPQSAWGWPPSEIDICLRWSQEPVWTDFTSYRFP